MPFTQMSPANYHCLDINYKTEMELKALNTYFFVLFVFMSFFFFHLNNFMTFEIRRLYSELFTLKQAISQEENSESSECSEASDGESESDSSSSDDSDDSDEETSGLVQTIKFRGRKYRMN